MKFAEALPGVLVLALRLVLLPPDRWIIDWIAALSILWIAVSLTRENSRPRHWALGIACVWLTAIYAVHQAVWTFAGWK